MITVFLNCNKPNLLYSIDLTFLFVLQIEDGEIFATINQKDGMVQFHDNPEKYNSAFMLLQLDKEVIHRMKCLFECFRSQRGNLHL